VNNHTKPKACAHCKETKTAQEFHLVSDRHKNPILSSKCKLCQFAYDSRPYIRFTRARTSALKLGKTWTLSKEEYAALVVQPCTYCGYSAPEVGKGLDRLNNYGGYTPDNVTPACGTCNGLKGYVFKSSEMKLLGEVVARIRDARPADDPLLSWNRIAQQGRAGKRRAARE
jgi:hypothetical protein